jgi:hypothetical protein
MNLASLDARNIAARQRLKAAADALTAELGTPALVTPTAVELRQPAVAQMRELECIAQLLEAITGELAHGPEKGS